MRHLEFLACALVVGCSTEGATPPAPIRPATPPAAVHPMHEEPELGLRFPLATEGVTFQMWHFDATLPPEKFRHEIQLSTSYGVAVIIDVWDNPAHLDVAHWVDQTIAGFFDATTVRSERSMSRARGLYFEIPPIEGGTAQVFAAFANRDRAYLFHCPQALEDTAGRAMFDEIVSAFEAEVPR